MYRFAQHERGRENFRSDENSINHATSRLHGRQAVSQTELGHTDSQSQGETKGEKKNQQNKSNFKLEVFGFSRSEREKVDDLSQELEEFEALLQNDWNKRNEHMEVLERRVGHAEKQLEDNDLRTEGWKS